MAHKGLDYIMNYLQMLYLLHKKLRTFNGKVYYGQLVFY